LEKVLYTKVSHIRRLTSTYQKRLDRLMSDGVCWMSHGGHRAVREFELISCFFEHIRWGPVVVIHRPKKVVMHFRYVHTTPPHSLDSRLRLEDIDNGWMHFSKYLAPVGQICVVPEQCALDYIDWFYMISHPFMRPAQPGDLVRHPPIMQMTRMWNQIFLSTWWRQQLWREHMHMHLLMWSSLNMKW